MALTAGFVKVAVTGAVYRAPAGTTEPTTAAATPAAGYKDLGYISDEGVTMSRDESTTDIRAWQNGALVRRVKTEDSVTFQFTMIETNEEVLKTFYGDANYSGGTVSVTGDEGFRGLWIVDVIDGTHKQRYVIHDGQVTERGDVSLVNGEAIAYPVTVTAYPVSGEVAKIYLTPASGLSA
jgi:hypothetical protein